MKCWPVERDTNLGPVPVEDGIKGDFFFKLPYMGTHANVLPVQKIK